MIKCEIVVQRLGFYLNPFQSDISRELGIEEVRTLLKEAFEGNLYDWLQMLDDYVGNVSIGKRWKDWNEFDLWVTEIGNCFETMTKLQDADWKKWDKLEEMVFLVGETMMTTNAFIELVNELDPMGEHKQEYLVEFSQGL